MSYARFGDEGSDVYVFLARWGLECCGCMMTDEFSFTAKTTDEMIAHLSAHRAGGDLVPDGIEDELRQDQVENDNYIQTGKWLDD